MNVGDVINRAIVEYYNNPGTSNDSLTPPMVAHWIEKSLKRYWGIFQDNNFGYFASRENVLSVSPASNIYTVPNGNSSTTLLTFSGVPVSGNLILSVNGVAVTIAYNTTASALQTTLNTLFTPSAIQVSGGPPGTPITITWGFVVTALSQTSTSLLDANGLTVQTTPITSNLNVAFITAMAVRTGSAPNYQYSPISTFYPNQKYGVPAVWGNGLSQIISNGSGIPLSWCYEAGAPDPFSQLPTMSVRLSPWPNQSMTLVYDCVRYPNRILYDDEGQPILTQELDLPLHFHDGVVMDVLINAYIRMKADTQELVRQRDDFDKSQFNVELRSLQRQGPDTIQTAGWNSPFGGW